MQTIEIYMKSGRTILVKCDDASFTFDKMTLEYTGYSFKGLKFPLQLSLVPHQIEGWARIK